MLPRRAKILVILSAVGLCIAAPLRVLAADCSWSPLSGPNSVIATGAADCTFTPATGTTSDGMALDGVGAISVKVCAASGQTITTKFVLIGYTMDPYDDVWSRDPSWDLPNVDGETGAECQVVGTKSVVGPVGRLVYGVESGAVSSGTITIKIIASEFGRGRLL